MCDFPEVPRDGRALHLAVGMFDGVHLGHQAVIEAAVHSARREEGRAGVLTFHPHPSRLFRPDEPTRLLMPPEVKAAFLHRLGVEVVIEKEFDRAFAALPAEGFVAHLREALPDLRALYVGENFRFGAGRKGDVKLLIETARALGLHIFSAERLRADGEPISSTRIRESLVAGKMDEVNALLGYAYRAEGVLESGAGRGRTIGFPTLNLRWEPELRPPYGVYAVTVRAIDESGLELSPALPCVANYGVRPTVTDDPTPWLEMHVLGETDFGPGHRVRAQWQKFLRPEQRFGSLEELREQIARDTEEARAYFGL